MHLHRLCNHLYKWERLICLGQLGKEKAAIPKWMAEWRAERMCMVAEERGRNAGMVGGMENTWSERRRNLQSSRSRKYGFEERARNAGVVGGMENHVVITQAKPAVLKGSPLRIDLLIFT